MLFFSHFNKKKYNISVSLHCISIACNFCLASAWTLLLFWNAAAPTTVATFRWPSRPCSGSFSAWKYFGLLLCALWVEGTLSPSLSWLYLRTARGRCFLDASPMVSVGWDGARCLCTYDAWCLCSISHWNCSNAQPHRHCYICSPSYCP